MILRAGSDCEKSDWIGKPDMKKSRASEIRLAISGNVSPKMMKNKRSKRFQAYLEWAKEFLENHPEISFKIAKKQHKELIGPIGPGAWSAFSRRVRNRLKIQNKIEREGRAKLYSWVPES